MAATDIVETELHSNETLDKSAEVFLNSYKNMEDRHPELPLVFIRGLYYYLENVKREFVELNKLKQSSSSSTTNYSTTTTVPNNSNNHNNNNKESINMSSSSSSSSSSKSSSANSRHELENFEHTRIVQMIVKSISTSSNENRWVTVNY